LDLLIYRSAFHPAPKGGGLSCFKYIVKVMEGINLNCLRVHCPPTHLAWLADVNTISHRRKILTYRGEECWNLVSYIFSPYGQSVLSSADICNPVERRQNGTKRQLTLLISEISASASGTAKKFDLFLTGEDRRDP
jgi:hypothetical protein